MPILLSEINEQKTIYILNTTEVPAFLETHKQAKIKNIMDCLSSDLASLNVYAGEKCLETTWPLDSHIFSEELIHKIAPIASCEQYEIIEEAKRQSIGNNETCRAFIPICKDRECIVMLLWQGHDKHFMNYVSNPNKIYRFGIPSVPVSHVHMANVDLAVSECLYEHGSVTWQPTTEGIYQRLLKDTDETLTWLRTSDDLYLNVVLPFLNMVQTLHENKINHGDITDDNVIMSENRQQLFFIDFETLSSIPYVDAANSAQNNTGYYVWHMARLYDLASLSYAIVNLATRYISNAQENDCIIQYFHQLGGELEEVCDEYDAYIDSDDSHFTLDKDCIDRHKHTTIAGVSDTVQRLHTPLTSISTLDVRHSKKRTRMSSMFHNEDNSKEPNEQDLCNNKECYL